MSLPSTQKRGRANDNVKTQGKASLLPLVVALIGALVACAASDVHLCPYPRVDGPLLFVGFSFAVCIHWKGIWSRALVIRSVVEAIFFRCAMLYLMGNDIIRLMAIRDAGLALMVLGALKFAARQKVQQSDENAGGAPPFEAAVRDGHNETMECLVVEPDGAMPPDQAGEPVRSPVQFTLRGMLLATAACAAVLSLAVTLGFRAAFAVLAFGAFWWLLARCVQIVRLGHTEEP